MAKKKRPARGRTRRVATPSNQRQFASIFPGVPEHPSLVDDYAIPDSLIESAEKLEKDLNLPVWLLIQDKEEEAREFAKESYNSLGEMVRSAFFDARHAHLEKGKPIALVIDSNGGQARPTYEIAMLLRRHCGGFVAVIPRHAKSAATLLTLGADMIIMNPHSELGPLDVQIWDPDREDILSGLDEYQSLQRLQAFSLETVDRLMLLYLRRTRKKVNNLFPFVHDFVATLMRPLFEKIDVVRYTQMSRALKVAEEYGKRLLERSYGDLGAEIAQSLVEDYPEHGFPIYPDELRRVGLNVSVAEADTHEILEEMSRSLSGINVVGKVIQGTVAP